MISKKGTMRLNTTQTSIILTEDVFGRELSMLVKTVTMHSIRVTFTVMLASKSTC